MIDFLQQLQLSASVKGLSLKVNDKGFTVEDLEEYFQIVQFNLLRVIINVNVHLFPRLKATSLGLYMEDTLLEDVSFKCLLFSRLTRVCPWLHSDFVIVRHFESPL